MSLTRALVPRLRRYASGRLLDAGCGVMPFKRLLKDTLDEYHSIDIEKRLPEVDFVGDLQDMNGVAAESYDVILCTEVLEHVPRPERLMEEAWRVLKPGGKLILSVPHLSRLHEEPFDYYRFTKYGLNVLFERNSFSVLELVSTGSLFSFFGHQISTAIVGSTWHIPLLGRIVFLLNAGLCSLPCYALDKLFPLSERYPLGYVAVVEKSSVRSLG